MIARTTAGLVLAIGAMLAAVPAAAQEDNPSPWTPYTGEDWVTDAGEVCSFPVGGHVVSDRERYRTTQTFPDGSPRYQEWTGQLIIRFTNLDSGESVERNLTGRGDFEYFADGSWSLTAVGGHFAGAMGPGSDPEPGWFVVRGSGYTLHSDADGNRSLTYGHGTVENLCETLG
ncbi:MAG: hypothetical protein ACRDOY_08650 [Nocardioidaceae bacterium]